MNTENKMTGSYKVIFVLSIFMFFFVLFAGAATQSKSSGLGMYVWGYTAWLMYKRRISVLASFYKVLLWFDIIVACIAVAVLAFGDSDVTIFIGYSLLEKTFLFALVILLTYGLYRYFSNMQFDSSFNATDIESDNLIWEEVSDEIKNGVRIDSLWIRAFSEVEGDISRANARYIKYRVDQIKSNNSSYAKSTNFSQQNLKIFRFMNRFNFIGKISILGIIIILCYGIYSDYKGKNSIIFNRFDKKSYEGWTQEDTGTKEIGPWLDNSPTGTRFCKNYDGTIQRLYPPGTMPNGKEVNPFCFLKSVNSPRLL